MIDALRRFLQLTGLIGYPAWYFPGVWIKGMNKKQCPGCGMPYRETETTLPNGALGCEVCYDAEHGIDIMSCGHPRSASRCEDETVVQATMRCMLCELVRRSSSRWMRCSPTFHFPPRSSSARRKHA